jgi:hypothetical protein
MDEGRHDVLEDGAVRDAGAMAAQGVRRCDDGALGEEGGELFPERLQQAYWHDRHGFLR